MRQRIAAVLGAGLLLSADPGVWAQAPSAADSTPPSRTSAEHAAMAGVAEQWKTAYNSGDAARVAALYSEDAYYLSAHVLAHGRDEIEAYWKRGIVAGGHIDTIQPLMVFASGDLGYTAGTYRATNAGVSVDGRVLLVFRRIGGRWLIAAHETVVRDQP